MDSSPYGSGAPKAAVTKRYKLVWRALLISNLALGAYMFAKAGKKNTNKNDNDGAKPSKEEIKASPKSPQAQSEIMVVPETQSEITAVPEIESEMMFVPEAQSEIMIVQYEPIIPCVLTQPARPRELIREDQQRELFKWILEEKRKIKPKDSKEKKQIDEDKAILKRFIRAEMIPKFFTDDDSIHGS